MNTRSEDNLSNVAGEFRFAGSPENWRLNASAFIGTNFLRQYEKIGDFLASVKYLTFVEVKLYGQRIFSIEHHLNSVNGVPSISLVGQYPHKAEFTTHGS